MYYEYDYLYLSFLFLLIIVFRYFTQRHFPSLRDRLFGFILIVSIVDLVFDIASSLVIENVFILPSWLTLSVCYVFYLLQSLFPFLMLTYIISISGRKKHLQSPYIFGLALPASINYILIFLNIGTNLLFYVDPIQGYVHASLFIVLYINCAIYILATAVYTLMNRKSFIPEEYRTVLASLAIISLFMLLQYLFPSKLFTSAAIALSITLMYIVMQKPEDMIDSVSGAFNHNALHMFTKARLEEHKPISFVVLELLYMRRINRLFGVSFGSTTLKAVAQEIRAVSPSGWLFRGIGNVFILISNTTEESERAYADLCKRIESEIEISGIKMSLTATIIGLPDTTSIHKAEDLDECIDNSLSSVPRGGRHIMESTEIMNDKRRDAVEDALFKAVKDDALSAYLQPIYEPGSGMFKTAEALARFPHKTLGMIPPGEFIEIAEKNGLIITIDEQIVRKVCRYIRDNKPFETLGLTAVEINLSPIEFVNEEFCDRLIGIADEYGVDPSTIWFEITESGMNADFRLLSSSMNKLKAKGFRFVLDDYGIGYSNVSRIMNLPFSVVKLDRSMMLDSMRDDNKQLVIRSTIKMFNDLKLLTVVEGVETQEQADAMTALGVDYIQGFFYARPMPLDSFTDFLKSDARQKGLRN